MREFTANHPTLIRIILILLGMCCVLCANMAFATPQEVTKIEQPTRQETRLEAQIIAAQQSAAWDLRAANYNIAAANEAQDSHNWSEWSKRLDMAGLCLRRAMKSYWKAEKLAARLEKMRERRR